MERDYRFDIARVLCMTFIIVYLHLYGYVYGVKSAYFMPEFAVLTDACLGLFTFVSGYLIGKKYVFGLSHSLSEVWQFYLKRILRVVPLFLLAAWVLYLIGFNDAKATLTGVFCVSLFVKPRPMTLWYIPVILFCYFITPMVCRKGFVWRLVSSSVLFLIVFVLRRLIPSIDWRFQYNLLFYLIGLVSVSRFDWRFEKLYYVKWIVVALFMVLLVLVHFNTPGAIYKRWFSGIGVFALLFICDFLAKSIFRNDNSVAQVVSIVSYASMACYMFHRFFYWIGELIWNPATHWIKWVYMAGFVFPLMIIFSFFIQKGYDFMINRILNKK